MSTSAAIPGLILLISGPSGVGKTTLCSKLLLEYPGQLQRAVTTTSRIPRPGEVDGIDYYFISPEKFEAEIMAGAFYEYARVHDQWKGVYRHEIESRLNAGVDVLLNIDVQGAAAYRSLAKKNPFLQNKIASVFIMPNSISVLRTRLGHRGDVPAKELEIRLKQAVREIRAARRFDYRLRSGTPEEDILQLQALYMMIKLRHARYWRG